jgi:hypothetical protein
VLKKRTLPHAFAKFCNDSISLIISIRGSKLERNKLRVECGGTWGAKVEDIVVCSLRITLGKFGEVVDICDNPVAVSIEKDPDEENEKRFALDAGIITDPCPLKILSA